MRTLKASCWLKFQQQVMSSISRSLVLLTLKRPPGPAVRTGPFQSSAGCFTESASTRLGRRCLKLATVPPVFAATPTQRRTLAMTRSWRCVLNPVSVYLSLCHRCFCWWEATPEEAVGVGRAGKQQTPLSLYQDDGGQLSESDTSPRQFLHRGGENNADVMFQHPTAFNMCDAAQEEPLHDAKTPSAAGYTPPQEPAVPRVPLRVTARWLCRFLLPLIVEGWLMVTSLIARKLSAADQSVGPEGQSGPQHRRRERLAAVQEPWRGECRPASHLSARARGDQRCHADDCWWCVCCENHQFPNVLLSAQGIFISRIIQGGASEKAGIHVGDRLLEVGKEIFFSIVLIFLVEGQLLQI